MTPAWLLIASLGFGRPLILAVEVEALDGRPALRLVSSAPLSEVGLTRQQAQLVVSVKATAPARFPPLALPPPLESVRFRRSADSLSVLIGVAPDVSYELRRREETLIILFGEQQDRPPAESARRGVPPHSDKARASRDSFAAGAAPGAAIPSASAAPTPVPTPTPTPSPTPAPLSAGAGGAARAAAAEGTAPEPGTDVRSLYARIFPAPGSRSPEGETRTETAPERAGDDLRTGLAVGPVRVRPQGDVLYVDAETTLETATPVRDDYFEFRPRLAADTPLGPAQLAADYEARLRRGTIFEVVGSTTHLANAALFLPARLFQAQAIAHYARGVLETTEVDAGREYFFKLGRFTHRSLGLSLRTTTGGRIDLQGSLGLEAVDLDQQAGFVPYDGRRATAGLRYELTPSTHGSLVYAYERVLPPADRPEVASRSHGGVLTVEGELVPLLDLAVSLGYLSQENPEAGAGGRSYRGLTVDGRIRKQFTPASSVVLALSRDTQVSAFESNGFYVSSAARAEAWLPLPLSVSLRSGAEYRWNDYRTVASEIGEPRADRLFAWTVGAGRPLGRWSYVRADYRHDRRRSNLSRLNTSLDGFTVQIGFGAFAESRP